MEMRRKTKLMQQVEESSGQPLETLLPQLVIEQGIREAAAQLGVSTATIAGWMARLGYSLQWVKH